MFGGSAPRQPPGHSPYLKRLNVVLTYGIPPHTVQLVRRANCPCCSRVMCLRTGELENCAIHFNGFLIDHSLLLLHFVLLTDAAAVLVFKEKPERT